MYLILSIILTLFGIILIVAEFRVAKRFSLISTIGLLSMLIGVYLAYTGIGEKAGLWFLIGAGGFVTIVLLLIKRKGE